ncbi:hypothetical protein SAMN02745121_04214 [Nannocystis exedens]|uniref:Uncharacterized protein n=1 Tax=Nannocystis exedens TaxID=54 RepID=A0A1I2AER1_9BACT|nr:hypothetical protein [Nannocystis exedens]PCC69789.1 hypothetical protein NAEX_02815 [Nannocystis exedens]SFE42197.1 hypothetical protein SAMN02745121_04214 [Nannocystis exedens]
MRLAPRSLALVLALTGCDPWIPGPITGGSSGSGPPVTSTAGTDSDTSADPTLTATDSGGTAGDTCTTCDSATEAVFVIPPEPPPACDVYAQDCPSGFKCSAEGPPPLDYQSITCSPIVAEPDQAGEACQVLVQGHFGPDTCDVGLFCDEVDPQTGTGTCAVICQGSSHQPICGADEECFGYHQMPLCVPHCDPLLQDCPAGDSCQYAGVDFVCLDVDGLPANQLFEGCGGDWRCAPGLSCEGGEVAEECFIGEGGEGPGCCSPYCDLSDPVCPGAGQQCRAYYAPGKAPAGLEHVGVCALP